MAFIQVIYQIKCSHSAVTDIYLSGGLKSADDDPAKMFLLIRLKNGEINRIFLEDCKCKTDFDYAFSKAIHEAEVYLLNIPE